MRERTLRAAAALHARPLHRLVQEARRFSSEIVLVHAGRRGGARNVVELLLLGVPRGGEVTLSVSGADEEDALEALAALLGDVAQLAEPPAAGEPSRAGDGPGSCPADRQSVTAGAAGIGVGRLWREAARRDPPRRSVLSATAETARLSQALAAAARATLSLVADEDPFSDIFRAQHTLLGDPVLEADLRRCVEEGGSAEWAVVDTFAALARRFEDLSSDFAAERHADLADVSARLLQALAGGTSVAPAAGQGRLVLALTEATPSGLLALDLERVAAVVSHRGGPTSHAAIVARGRGLPLVFAAEVTLREIPEGAWLRVDGDAGSVERLAAADELAPSPDELSASDEPSASDDLGTAPREGGATAPVTGGDQPRLTADGTRILLRANLGAPGDLAAALAVGCEGCGVLRSELLFAGRREPPTVAEQMGAYARVAAALAPHPTIIRLFDPGPDKPLPFLPLPPGMSAGAVGPRSLDRLLARPEVLGAQLSAIDRARQETGADVRALVPMVVDRSDLLAVRRHAPEGCPLGAMIETPAAALLAASLAGVVTFLSIGTNDLAGYTLAADRALGPRRAPVHPAVLRLVSETVRAAATRGVECSVCGELAGDAGIAPLLVGLGVRVLSLAPRRAPAVGQALRDRRLGELEALAQRALAMEDEEGLAELLVG